MKFMGGEFSLKRSGKPGFPDALLVSFLGLFLFFGLESVALSEVGGLENKLTEIYLDTLENGVDVFEPLYTDQLTDAPDSGFYDFRQYENWTHPRNESYHTLCMIPGNGQVVLTYATLLKYTDKKHFGKLRYPRELLLDHARKTIRWICLTSAYVDQPYPFLPEMRSDLASGEQWRRKWGLRQDLLGYLSIGAALLWNDLDAEIRHLFQQVAVGGALQGRVTRSADAAGNGNHDQVKQDLSSTMAAAYLFPEHSDHAKFMDAVAGAGIDLVCSLRDFSSNLPVGDKSLKDLALGHNFNPDYSSLHHNHPSLWYGVEKIFEGRLYVEVLSRLTGIPVPATYHFAGNGFDGVYRYASILTTRDGVMMHLRSPEYDCCYGEGLLAFCYGGVLKNDPAGAFLEMKAAEILRRHTQAVGQFDSHRGSWGKAALGLIMHRMQPGGPYREAGNSLFANLDGTHAFQMLRTLVHRSDKVWTGFVWGADGEAGAGGPGAYVVPTGVDGPLVYNTSDGLVGSVLRHRPLWLYLSLAGGFLMLAGLGLLSIRGKRYVVGEILLFTAMSVVVVAALVAWVDLQYTLPQRIPSAEVPRWAFAVVGMGVAFVMLGSAWMRHGDEERRWRIGGKTPLFALWVVPTAILLMVRTPWRDIFQGSTLVDAPWVHLAVMLLAPFALSLRGRGNRSRLLVAVFALAYLIYCLGCLGYAFQASPLAEPFYLRLVSIRNFPRVYLVFGVGAAVFVAGVLARWLVFRKWKLATVVEVAGVFFAAGVAVALLSFGRFDLPRVVTTSRAASDDGFATSGEFVTSAVTQKLAFFSFDQGPGILLMDIIGRKNALVSFSGLPVPFYAREGFVAARSLSHAAGEGDIALLSDVPSRWWAVEKNVGMVFGGGDPVVSGQRRLGANWARTEAYLDRMDVVSASPIKLRLLRQGESLLKVAAGVYPGVGNLEMQEIAGDWRELDPKTMDDGWRGVLASTGKKGLVLAVANLGDQSGVSEPHLSMEGWAPVFSTEGVVSGAELRLPLALDRLATYRDRTDLLIRSQDETAVRVVKTGTGSYRLEPVTGEALVQIRWVGAPLKHVVMDNGAAGEHVSPERFTATDGVEVALRNPCILTFFADDLEDAAPPFVEVVKISPEADGRLLVSADAQDQSDIASVTLYKDGEPVGQKSHSPYEWTIKMAGDYHSFMALAVDASPAKNQRFSHVSSWSRLGR